MARYAIFHDRAAQLRVLLVVPLQDSSGEVVRRILFKIYDGLNNLPSYKFLIANKDTEKLKIQLFPKHQREMTVQPHPRWWILQMRNDEENIVAGRWRNLYLLGTHTERDLKLVMIELTKL